MAPDEAVDDHGFAVTGGAVEQQVGHPRLVRVGEQVVEFGQDVLSASVADPTGAADPFNPLVIGEQQGRGRPCSDDRPQSSSSSRSSNGSISSASSGSGGT